MSKLVQNTLLTIGILALIFIIGSVGALERNMITCTQCIVQSIIGVLVMLGAFKLCDIIIENEEDTKNA